MNPPLLAQDTINQYLTREAAWAESHGASEGFLGMGLLYYTLTYVLKAQVAVCLGSGGGFVPRLMRQAQRDLGIAETSRTILVDGNVPEAGWGSPQWLAPDSLFRAEYPDVEIIPDLTSNAAQNFFTPEGLSIDYLHIDANHTFKGCYEDFTAFRPFLHEGSIVTLHDTNYPGAGVKQVIEHIRTLSGCEVVDIPEVGEGTALVRIGKSTDSGPYRGIQTNPGSEAGSIKIARKQEAPPVPPPEKEWKYLESPAFATRYVLAANFVRGCRSVIEIGGAKTPIDQFLEGDHQAILVIDPLISESHQDTWRGQSCQVAHLHARFQDLEWTIPPGADFGLMMLGMEFQGMSPENWHALFQLIERARVTVIEFPMSWETSRTQFQTICANTHTRVTYRAKLDLEGNDFGDLSNSWPPRTDRAIFVLEPHQPPVAAPLPQLAAFQPEPHPTPPEAQPAAPSAAQLAESSSFPSAQLIPAWQSALSASAEGRSLWRSAGGHWRWQADGVVVTSSGAEWSNLEWQTGRPAGLDGIRNFVLEVNVSGKADAAGLSFGPYKDFLAPLNDKQGSHRLQLEVDANAQRWAFRIDGQLQNRFWWDAAIHKVDDLLGGVFTFKARNAHEVHFHDLALHQFASSCKLSVIISCFRFARRLRLSLHNWCHTVLPHGAFEVLVTNAQSPDGTHEHLAAVSASYPHLRVRELPVPANISRNKGTMINRAIEASLGEWIWLTDADCLFAPESAAIALQHVGTDHNTLFFGQRRHLSIALTDALLAGRLDSLADFAYLAGATGPRLADNAPWGYTQIAHRSVFNRLRYSERVNHFDQSDDIFVNECRQHGIATRQVPDLFCLHLDHPFAWYGTDSFL